MKEPPRETSPRREAIVVALDGPAGAGKSTVARKVAEALGFTLLDTGALYRTVALACRRTGVSFDDAAGATSVAERLVQDRRMVLEKVETAAGGRATTDMRIRLDGELVGDTIRTAEISMGASTVSAIGGVRTALLDVQRDFVRHSSGVRGLVCEGRDIGTVIFPDADVKIFLTASVDERARRRHPELLAKDPAITLEQTRAAVIARDAQDEGRAVAPLRKADDAIVVDSTGGQVEETVARILALVEARLAARDGEGAR
jgi:cytidylate kinase